MSDDIAVKEGEAPKPQEEEKESKAKEEKSRKNEADDDDSSDREDRHHRKKKKESRRHRGHNSRSPERRRHSSRSPERRRHSSRSPERRRRHHSRSPDRRRRSPERRRHHSRSPDRRRHRQHSSRHHDDDAGGMELTSGDAEVNNVTENKEDKGDAKEKDTKDTKEKEEPSSRDRRDRDYARDRDRSDRHRSDRGDRDRDYRDRRDRDREYRDRDRDRDRDYRSSRDYHDRDRDRDHRDRSDRDRSSERRTKREEQERHKRSTSRRRRQEREEKDKESATATETDGGAKEKLKTVSLKDIMSANPGISLPEAVQRLNAYNTAAAQGIPMQHPSGEGLISAPGQGTGAFAPMTATSHATHPSVAATLLQQGSNSLGMPLGAGGAATKSLREIYIGNLPPGVTIPQLTEFVNTVVKQLGFESGPTGSVCSAWVSSDGHYGFAELTTLDECNSCLANMNGMQLGAFQLKVGRPKGGANGTAGLAAIGGPSVLGNMGVAGSTNPLLMAAGAPAGALSVGTAGALLSFAVMVGNLPVGIAEEQVKELVSPFGEVSKFNMIKDASGSTQSAVFEYKDTSVTDGAVTALNGLPLGEYKLTMQRVPHQMASVLLSSSDPVAASSSTDDFPEEDPDAAAYVASLGPNCVLRLSNMVSAADLTDAEAYDELMEDVADECNSHKVSEGPNVLSIAVPRPSDGGAGLGKIFVHFTCVEAAVKTRASVSGRFFNGKTVRAEYYPEGLLLKKVYDIPAGYVASQSVSELEDENADKEEMD